MNIIPITQHPLNNDPSATLVHTKPFAIYKTDKGFIVCLGFGECFEKVFETLKAAQEAQYKKFVGTAWDVNLN